jgi:type II secretory pathway pseudopilin PulG
MTRSKLVLTGAILAAAVLASLLLQRRTQAKLRENEAALRQQDSQLAELGAENQRLSNLVVQTKTDRATAEDRTAELALLRAKVEALRQQTNQLATQLAENRRLVGAQFFARGDFNLLDHEHESATTFAGGPRETGKLNDVRALTAALRMYADQHQGEFPLSLDKVAPYLPKPLEADSPPWVNAPLTGTNDFEIVYQGSQNALTNIPPRRVELIRERKPWLTPDGKWARVYGHADGAASTVESDDNFQFWDAQHIIPARSVGQQ